MLKIVTASPGERQDFIQTLKARAGTPDSKIEQSVAQIISTVQSGGDEAVKAYSRQFDGWTPDSLELSRQEMEAATRDCGPDFLAALKRAAANIYDFHTRQKQQSRIDAQGNGIITGQRVRGLHRVGVYGPGGTAPVCSYVLIKVIPPTVAGVG